MTGFFAKAIVTGLVVAGFISERPLPFLKQGSEITYSAIVKSPGDKVKQYKTVINIENSSRNGSFRSASGTVHFEGDPDFKDIKYLQYFSADSLAFYASCKNYIYNSYDDKMASLKLDNNDSLIYPFTMKTGDTLRSSTLRFTVSVMGAKSKCVMNFDKRIVVRHDTLDLPIGRIAAWKIESEMNLNTVVSAYGSTRKEKQSGKLNEWFSPEYGIVKTERDMDDHSTVIEMSLIK
jgi:hypothetical protein